VLDVPDAAQALGVHQLGDLHRDVGLVDLIGHLGEHDLLTVGRLLDVADRPHADAAAPRLVCLPDPGRAHDVAPGREVGTRHDAHQLVEGDVRVLDLRDHRGGHLPQVV